MGFPANLHKRLHNKLRFQDFDAGERVQMIIDEDEERMYLRAIKELQANEDAFLVDHAWTFKHRTAYKDLSANEKLVERLQNIMKFPNKLDMPIENPYAKPRPTLEEQLKKYAESTEPVKLYDLEGYGIEELSTITFRPEVEEINLWSNKIHNPNDVTEILMKLPNLKACWLNDNPVE